MRKKILAFMLGMTLTGMLLTGCGSEKEAETSNISSAEKVNNEVDENVVYAKVTKVSNNEVTYEILERDKNAPDRGEMSERPEGSAMPEGEAPEKPEGSAMPEGEAPEKPEGSAMPEGEAPERPEGSASPEEGKADRSNRGMMGFSSTGESKTLTIEADIKIQFVERDGTASEASVSDITEDTLIQLVYSEDEELTEIDIPKMNNKSL